VLEVHEVVPQIRQRFGVAVVALPAKVLLQEVEDGRQRAEVVVLLNMEI